MNDASLKKMLNSLASGINQIAIDDPDGQWFDINGQRLEKRPTQQGVYIFRDNKNRKIKVRIK